MTVSKFTKSSKTISLISLCGAALLMSHSAIAGDKEEEMAFNYNKYELTSSKSAQKLYKRLGRQVKSFCNANNSRSLAAMREASACRKDMMNHFVQKIDHPQITALYKQQNVPVYASK